MIGAVLGFAARKFGPRLAREAIESQASRQVGKVVGRRVAAFTAGEAGQRVATRVVGEKAAQRLATPAGQKLTTWAVKKETSSALQGEGDFAPTKPTKVVNITPTANTPTRASVDPSQMNLVPGDTAKEDQQKRALQQQKRPSQQADRRGQRGGGGTSKGWWEMNEQVTQHGAFSSDVTKLGNFDVARGPTNWVLPGKTLANKTIGRSIGFVEGYRSVKPIEQPAEKAEFPTPQLALNPGQRAPLGLPAAGKTTQNARVSPPNSTGKTYPMSTKAGEEDEPDSFLERGLYGKSSREDLSSSFPNAIEATVKPQRRKSNFDVGAGPDVAAWDAALPGITGRLRNNLGTTKKTSPF